MVAFLLVYFLFIKLKMKRFLIIGSLLLAQIPSAVFAQSNFYTRRVARAELVQEICKNIQDKELKGYPTSIVKEEMFLAHNRDPRLRKNAMEVNRLIAEYVYDRGSLPQWQQTIVMWEALKTCPKFLKYQQDNGFEDFKMPTSTPIPDPKFNVFPSN